MLKDFTEAELNQMISSQTEEDLHLDYKGADSLTIADGRKKEVGKDISAFANSDGGIVIYGIREFDEVTKRHLPEKIDPIDRTLISKEWLEQVINSNIQPKINGLTIHPVPMSSAGTHVVYVVDIPKSNTVHQASDKKYYKRYNFESVAMEDYEIKDIVNRQLFPDLELILSNQVTFVQNVLKFPIIVRNKSIRLAKDVKVTVEFVDFQNYDIQILDGFQDSTDVNPGRKIYSSRHQTFVYNGLDASIGLFSLTLKENIFKVTIKNSIYCDNVVPICDIFEIFIQNNIPTYNIIINSSGNL
jgi:hypothetical protein